MADVAACKPSNSGRNAQIPVAVIPASLLAGEVQLVASRATIT